MRWSPEHDRCTHRVREHDTPGLRTATGGRQPGVVTSQSCGEDNREQRGDQR
jgi:hypothetical protein